MCDGREFFNGALSAFVYPLITNAFISSGGFSCSAPIEFAGRLKVTTEKTVGFYNVYYQLYEKAKVRTWTQQKDYADLINVFERCGADPKPARAMQTVRKSVTLAAARGKAPEEDLLALSHAGTIQRIRINPLYAPDQYSLNHVNLRIYYDGQERPAVDVPIGPFFGSAWAIFVPFQGQFGGVLLLSADARPEGGAATLTNRVISRAGVFAEIAYGQLSRADGARGVFQGEGTPPGRVEPVDYVLTTGAPGGRLGR